MRSTLDRAVALVILWIAAGLYGFAASPPTLVNYQGVLRNSIDAPLAGAFDMTFSLWDASTAGNQIVVDAHTGAGNVTVSNGLFNTKIGGGTVSDGSGPGTYTSIEQVFRDFTVVYLEVKIGAETLTPRTQIVAAAYALNASNLGGKSAGSFLDTSATAQTKSGLVTFDSGATPGATGVRGLGNYNGAGGSGGYFKDAAHAGEAFIGHGDTGIDSYGSYAGGIFRNGSPSAYNEEVYLGFSQEGILASGRVMGGDFRAIGASGLCRAAYQNRGVEGYGSEFGGYFSGLSTGNAYLGRGGYGIQAYGTYPSGMAGLFQDPNYTGEAWLADGNVGVFGYGNYSGGIFRYGTPSSYTSEVMLGVVNEGSRTYGFQNGGVFTNSYGSNATTAAGGSGVTASGSAVGGDFQDIEGAGLFYAGWGGVGGYGVGTYDESGAGGIFEDLHYSGRTDLGVGDTGLVARGTYQGGEFLLTGTSFFSRLPFSTCPGFFCNNYSIYGNGAKAFVQNHPFNPDQVVVYASLEGDEAGTYTRGSGQLVDGRAVVRLGASFALVTNPDIGLTVQLTPHGEPVGLAIESVSTSELVVRGPAGSNAVFDFVVNGLRLGTEYFKAVQAKELDAPLPVSGWKPPSALTEDALADTPYQRFAAMLPIERRSAAALDESNAARLVARVGTGRASDPPKVRNASVDLGRQREQMAQARSSAASSSATNANAAAEITSAASISQAKAAVLAEFPVLSTPVAIAETVEAGELLASEPTRPGVYLRARQLADANVVGIVLGNSGQVWTGQAPLALAGAIVACRVDATRAPIEHGDLLIASDLPGMAMAAGAAPKLGTVVGKALESLTSGTGTIRVLVMSR